MKFVLLLILVNLLGFVLMALPYASGAAILRVFFRSARPGLVALLAAVLLVAAADLVSILPFSPTFRTVFEIYEDVLAQVGGVSSSCALLCLSAAPVLVGGFLGTVAFPFLFALAGVKAVDRFRARSRSGSIPAIAELTSRSEGMASR